MIDIDATAIIDLASSAIERIWPDPAKQAEEKRKLMQLAQDGNIERLKIQARLLIAQADTNREAAKHKSVFVAGARPFIIWVCGVGLAVQYVLHPLLSWLWAAIGVSYPPPEPMDMSVMMPLLLGLLGLGSMRSYDKKQGTQTDSIG